MRYIHITKWQDHQHYKDRRPKWIKLYLDMIEEFDADGMPKPFYNLADSAKLTYFLLVCLRANYNKHIPFPNDGWLKWRLGTDTVDLQPLIGAGLISISSEPYQNDTVLIQDDTESLPPETKTKKEGEGEQETKTKVFEFANNSDFLFKWLDSELQFKTPYEKNTFRKYAGLLIKHPNWKNINFDLVSLIADLKEEIKLSKINRENMMKIINRMINETLKT